MVTGFNKLIIWSYDGLLKLDEKYRNGEGLSEDEKKALEAYKMFDGEVNTDFNEDNVKYNKVLPNKINETPKKEEFNIGENAQEWNVREKERVADMGWI